MTVRVRKMLTFFAGGAFFGGAVVAGVFFAVASVRTQVFADQITSLVDAGCVPFVVDGAPLPGTLDLRPIATVGAGKEAWAHPETEARLEVRYVDGMPACTIDPGPNEWRNKSIDLIWAHLTENAKSYLSQDSQLTIEELDVDLGRAWLARTAANPSSFLLWGEAPRGATYTFASITFGRAQFPEEAS